MAKLEEKENLTEWLKYPRSTEEYQQMMLDIDHKTKNIHDNGYIISHFYPDHIEVPRSEGDGAVSFHDNVIVEFKPRNQQEQLSFEEAKKQNIYSAAVIALNAYTNYQDWNLNFVRENFANGISILFPEEVVGYYSVVLTKGSNIYLSQFVKEKSKQEIAKLQSEIAAEENKTGRGNSLKKTNGKSVIDDNGRYNPAYNPDQVSNAAFMKTYFIPVLLLSLLAITVPLILVMLALD